MNTQGTVTFLLKANDKATKVLTAFDKEVDKTVRKLEQINNSKFNRLEAEEEQIEKGLRAIQRESNNTKKSLGGMNSISFGILATSTAMLSSAMFDAFRNSVNFSFQMDKLQAVTQGTDEEMKNVSSTILDLGAQTTRTNTEIAETAIEMGKLGYSAQDVTNALPGVVKGAEATGESLESMGMLIAIIQNQFDLTTDSAGRLADGIVVAANKSAAGTQYLIDAFKYAGPPAAALGVDINELGASMMVMADAGLGASQAGTTLRSVLTRLASPTDKMVGIMDQLGVSAFDADGNFVGLTNVLLQFNKAYESLNQEQQAGVANAVAGKTALSGFLVLVEEAPDKLEEYTKALEGSTGAAEEASAAMRDNLVAQLNSLVGSIEAVVIKILMLLEPALLFLIKTLIGLANKIGFVVSIISGFINTITELVNKIGEAIFGTDNWNAILAILAKVLSLIIGYMITYVVYQKLSATWTAIITAVTGSHTKALIKNALAFALSHWWIILIVGALAGLYSLYQNNIAVQEFVNNLFAKMGIILGIVGNFIQTYIVPALQTLYTIITEKIIPALQTFWQEVGQDLFNALVKVGLFLASIIIPVLSTLATFIVEKVIPALQSFWSWFQEYIMPILISVGQILMVLAQIFIILAQTVIEGVVIPILQMLWPILQTLGQILIVVGKIFITLAGVILSIVLPILQALATFIVTYILPVLMALAQFILEKVVPVIEKIAEVVTKLIEGALTALNAILQNVILPVLTTLATFIGEKVVPVIEKIAEVVTKLIEGALTALNAILQNVILPILETLKNILGKIRDVFIKIGNAITDTFIWALEQAKKPIEWFSDKIEWINGLLEKMFGWIGSVGDSIGAFADKLSFWNRSLSVDLTSEQRVAYARGYGIGGLQGKSLRATSMTSNNQSNIYDTSSVQIIVNSMEEAQQVIDNNQSWKEKMKSKKRGGK